MKILQRMWEIWGRQKKVTDRQTCKQTDKGHSYKLLWLGGGGLNVYIFNKRPLSIDKKK